jgi:hypothetical protein
VRVGQCVRKIGLVLRCQHSSDDEVVAFMCRTTVRLVGPASKVVMQNDGDLVEVILL